MAWDSSTDMQGLTVSAAFTQTQNNFKALDGSSGTAPINLLQDDDSDTKIQCEESADEDKIRFDTGGTERMTIENDGTVTKGTGCNVCLIKVGTYDGDGSTSKGITGVGFQPKYVKIWTRPTGEAAQAIFEKADDTWGDYAIAHKSGGGHESVDNRINSLDADGFTVDDDGSDKDPNANGTTYSYLALG